MRGVGIPTREVAEPAQVGASKWLYRGGRLDRSEAHGERHTHPWYKVLWLSGVDYFSTLGYQPGIALLAAGAVAPVATTILIAVTLACALPIYSQVAKRSYVGQGSIALLENLLPGWWGKTLVLILLGFAATDFVITMTLSAADAAMHAVENPYLHPYLSDAQLPVTLVLLVLLAVVFLKGFTEAIGVAMLVAVPYLALNLVVLFRGVVEVLRHPEALSNWQQALSMKGDWTGLMLVAALIFPRLALGLSGFETGVSVMPLVTGSPEDREGLAPAGRIRNTRKLLVAAALIMSVMLMLSSFVTTLLIPPEAYREDGRAAGRAIAYLAHEMLGSGFGTVYDISTILILWFAGASAMAGLLNLIPRYLPRFGMAPRWVAYSRPLILTLLATDVLVTLIFRADVEAQGGAYATGVLVLMLSAGVAAALALAKERRLWASLYCCGVSGVFAFTLIDNVIMRPDGILIASAFIVTFIGVGALSRSWRSTELRIADVEFVDPESRQLWKQIAGKKVNLVPVRNFDAATRARKENEIRTHYRAGEPLAFINVELLDNRSEFLASLKVRVRQEKGNYLIKVTQATAVANTIAYISELLDPLRLFLGLSRQSAVTQALRFLTFGEGETGLMVYTILVRYWQWTPEEDVRPFIFLMSD